MGSRTYIVVLILWEKSVPLLQEGDELVRHDVQLADVGVGVDVAVAGADGVVDEHDVGELVPGALVVDQRLVVLDSEGANLHQGAVLGAASRPAVQPDDGPLLVRNVLVLVVPKEDVAVVFGGDFDVSLGHHVSLVLGYAAAMCHCHVPRIGRLPCMHLYQGSLGGAGEGMDEVVARRLAGG